MPSYTPSPVVGTAAAVAVAGFALGSIGLRACTIPMAADRRGWRGDVYGHRGCRFIEGVVENTMEAYRYALDRGADGIEIDVRLCGSGDLVVFHDHSTSPACMGKARNVADMSKAEVHALRFCADEGKAARVPTLEAVLDLCVQRGKRLLLEVKHYTLRGTATIVKHLEALCQSSRYKTFLRDEMTVISFNPYLLYCLRRAVPWVAVGPLVDDATVSSVARGSCDADGHSWLQAISRPAFISNGLYFMFVHRVAAVVMGASLFCTREGLCTPEIAANQAAEGRVVYLYGASTDVPATLQGLPVCVSCDTEHDVVKVNHIAAR